MNIALSIWNCRIAPVFDVARHLLIAEVQDKKIVKQTSVKLPSGSVLDKVIKLQQLDINTLICGAVSVQVRSFVDMYEINIISFISGDVQEVLKSWISDNFNESDFAMPGCKKQERCKKGGSLCQKKRKVNH